MTRPFPKVTLVVKLAHLIILIRLRDCPPAPTEVLLLSLSLCCLGIDKHLDSIVYALIGVQLHIVLLDGQPWKFEFMHGLGGVGMLFPAFPCGLVGYDLIKIELTHPFCFQLERLEFWCLLLLDICPS